MEQNLCISAVQCSQLTMFALLCCFSSPDGGYTWIKVSAVLYPSVLTTSDGFKSEMENEARIVGDLTWTAEILAYTYVDAM